MSQVYFIRRSIDDAVKIGVSGDLRTRLRHLTYGKHGNLTIIRTITGDANEERWLHRRFAPNRIDGEWFLFDEDMLTVGVPSETGFDLKPIGRPAPSVVAIRFTTEERNEIRRAAEDAGMPESLWIRSKVRTSLRNIKAKAVS